jgi:hypothetical protein
MITRRFAISSAMAAILATIDRHAGLAQHSAQEVTNGLQVTSTGNVNVNQAASGQQEVGVLINGVVETEDGIYRTSSGQVVMNDGQITATGDVNVTQSASGTQTVYSEQNLGLYHGAPADRCQPGHVIADPTTGMIYFQGKDCCYWLSPCCQKCKSGKC